MQRLPLLMEWFLMMKNKKGTFRDLAQGFIDKLTNMTAGFSEVILFFDTYKPDSLKEKTRERCRQDKAAVQYKIEGDTNIKHILLIHLSDEKTKADLLVYLAQATLNCKTDSAQVFITSASGQIRSNRDLTFEENNHEEADTIMICLAAEASQRCPNAELVFFTPDTEILVRTL